MRVMAYIHSLKDEDHNLHVLDEATIIKSIGNNIYLADYNGVKCKAIFNPFTQCYFVDDTNGLLMDCEF